MSLLRSNAGEAPFNLGFLSGKLGNFTEILKFSESCRRFLDQTPHDGILNCDRIYITGKALAKSKVWEKVPASTLAISMRGVDMNALRLFLSAAPESYFLDVLRGCGRCAANDNKAVIHDGSDAPTWWYRLVGIIIVLASGVISLCAFLFALSTAL